MTIKRFNPIILLAALGLTLTVQAHSPKEHMTDAEQPNCKSMSNMDHTKMDTNDPVMQAMMKQCMKGMHPNESEQEEAQLDPQDDGKRSAEQHSEHQH